jgi:hypothetical protein
MVAGGVFSLVAGILQGIGLGMGQAGFFVIPLADYGTISYYHRADTGVGRGAAEPLPGFLKGQLHEMSVRIAHLLFPGT